MTPAQHLDNAKRRYGPYPSLARVTNPDAKLLLLKQRAREAYAICEGCGWGKLPEWVTPEYLDAREDYDAAVDEFQRLVANRRSNAAMERTIMGHVRAA
jgi:hypothetical protein